MIQSPAAGGLETPAGGGRANDAHGNHHRSLFMTDARVDDWIGTTRHEVMSRDESRMD